MRRNISIVISCQSGGVWCGDSRELVSDVRDVRLHKCQVDSPSSSLDTLNHRLNGSLPCSLPSGRAHAVSRFQTFHIDWVGLSSVLQFINDGVDVRLQNLAMVDVGGITECLMKLRMLGRRVMKAKRGEDEA